MTDAAGWRAREDAAGDDRLIARERWQRFSARWSTGTVRVADVAPFAAFYMTDRSGGFWHGAATIWVFTHLLCALWPTVNDGGWSRPSRRTDEETDG